MPFIPKVIQLQGDQRKNVSTFLVQVHIILATCFCNTLLFAHHTNLTWCLLESFLVRLGSWRKSTSRYTVSEQCCSCSCIVADYSMILEKTCCIIGSCMYCCVTDLIIQLHHV